MKFNKKGVSHVEIIISFAIFVGFLLFLFIVFPIRQGTSQDNSADIAEKGILEFIDGNVTYNTVSLNDSEDGCPERALCGTLTNIRTNMNELTKNAIVADERGEIIPINLLGDSISIFNKDKNFFQIYFSENFINSGGTSGGCTEISYLDCYQIGLKRELTVPLYEKIFELETEYNSRYTELKNKMGLPANKDFGFLIKDLQGTEILYAVKNHSQNIATNAREIPVGVMCINGTRLYLTLGIQTW